VCVWLELFGANNRKNKVGDQSQRDESDNNIFHGRVSYFWLYMNALDLFAGPDEENHQGKEA
jgi:hypothetical protein